MAGRGRMNNGYMCEKEREDFTSDLNSHESFGTQNRQNQRNNGNAKIHVSNIPLGLDERGLGNIFSAEGCIPERVYISKNNKKNPNPSSTWGFVEFKTAGEAQTAISAVHKKPPYDLFVQFAKVDRQDGYKDKMPAEKSPQGNMSQGSRGRGLLPFTKEQSYDTCKGPFSNDDCEEYKEISSSNRLQPRSPGEYYTPTSRDRVPSLPIEKYTHVEISDEMDLHVAAYISNRAKDLTIEDLSTICSEIKLALPFKPGQCTYCQRAAIYTCSRCKAWYCSDFCRTTHWAHHKDNCIPRSVIFQKDGALTYKDIPDVFCNEDSMKQKHFGSKGSRTSIGRNLGSDFRNNFDGQNGFDNHGTQNNGFENDTSSIHDKFSDNLDHRNPNNNRGRSGNFRAPDRGGRGGGQRNNNCKDRPIGKDRLSGGNQVVEMKSPTNRTRTDECSRSSSPQRSLGAEQPRCQGNNLEKCPIPAHVFTKVTIGAVGNEGEFWAYKVDDYNKQGAMMSELRDPSILSGPADLRFEIGSKCVAPYQGDLFRAEIIKIFREGVKVLFIDFGNEMEIRNNDLKMMPKHLMSIPPMAHKYVLATSPNNPPLQEEFSLSIKPVTQDKYERWVVTAEGVLYQDMNSC